ncbi:MAG: T9SS type A sorting domain-containing protein, partial [Bacteroidia bacterium]|nr:T9SS type A sorting domain-containing protein [Bacteroidia bacterium]
GIYPDSATNFASGTQGVPYSQVIQVRVPQDSIIIVGGFPVTATINLIDVTSIGGLPPGLSYTCNPVTCIYVGNSNGCAEIMGTPTAAGYYPLQAVLETNATIFGVPTTQIDTIDYYFIDIAIGIGIAEVNSETELVLNQNVPNPVTDYTQITYYSSKNRIISLTVHDLLGSLVYSSEMEAHKGENFFNLNLSGISSGIYVYSIGNDEVKATKRLVIAKE